MASQGTTPRRLTDLIGSLCDLTSGSGDKGTPVILVQGYFDNLTDSYVKTYDNTVTSIVIFYFVC